MAGPDDRFLLQPWHLTGARGASFVSPHGRLVVYLFFCTEGAYL